MKKIKTDVESKQHLPEAFDELKARAKDSPRPVPARAAYRVWLGYVMRAGLRDEYLKDRDKLAHAAYVGDWKIVKKYILLGESKWNETWANAFRLRKSLWLYYHTEVDNNMFHRTKRSFR